MILKLAVTLISAGTSWIYTNVCKPNPMEHTSIWFLQKEMFALIKVHAIMETWKVMEFERLISRPGEIMEIILKNCWKIIIFFPNVIIKKSQNFKVHQELKPWFPSCCQLQDLFGISVPYCWLNIIQRTWTYVGMPVSNTLSVVKEVFWYV